jgi:prepilin-type N-terminal cleavage/methylation domain-containing protein
MPEGACTRAVCVLLRRRTRAKCVRLAPRAKRACGGFSLVELVIVLFIMGALSGVALWRYSGSLSNYRADMAANKVAADLAFAQARARFTSERRTVAFFGATHRYTITPETMTAGSNTAYEINLTGEPYGARLGTLTVGNSGNRSVSFDAYGAPTGAGLVRVLVGNVSRTVTIDAQSGRASVTSP